MSDEKSPGTPRKKKRSWILRWFLRGMLLIVALLLSTPFVFRAWALWDIPNMPPPFDVDEFLAAPIPEDDNADVLYARALNLYVEPTPEEAKLRDLVLQEEDGSRQSAVAGLKDYFGQNAGSLKAWRAGTSKRYYVPQPLTERTLSSPDDADKLMQLSENAVVMSCLLDLQGRPGESREWIVAVVRNGRQGGHGGCLSDRLTGTRQLQLAYDRLEYWSAQPHVSKALLMQTISDLNEAWNESPSNTEVLKGEYVMLMNSIASLDHDDSWFNVYELIGQLDGQDDLVQSMNWIVGQEVFAQRMTKFYFNNQLAAVELPIYERPQQSEHSGLYDDPRFLTFDGVTLTREQFDRNSYMPWAELTRGLLGGLYFFPEFCERAAACHNSILLILAGQAYRRDRGHFPETLEQLVPEYLDAVPIDPFDGQPMKYNTSGEHPVVYSSYLNQVDDGGTSYDWRTMGSDFPLDYGKRMLSERVRPRFAP